MKFIEDIKDNDNILVLVLKDGEYSWYISNKYIWILNYKQYINAFNIEEDDFSERFNIGIVEHEYINVFLEKIDERRIFITDLRIGFKSFLPIKEWEESSFLFPSLFINFDDKILKSVYSEGLQFEEFVPSGWDGKYDDFYSEIPQEIKYWNVDGTDWFKVILENY
jgi:hypothetical protein